jgi:hypothetical protein
MTFPSKDPSSSWDIGTPDQIVNMSSGLPVLDTKSHEVIDKTAGIVEKMTRMSQGEKQLFLQQADKWIDSLITALISDDQEMIDRIFEEPLVLQTLQAEKGGQLMILLLQRGYLEMGFAICMSLLETQWTWDIRYLQVFFKYFRMVFPRISWPEENQDTFIQDVQKTLISYIREILPQCDTKTSVVVYFLFLEIAFFFDEFPVAKHIFMSGLENQIDKIPYVYARFLLEKNCEEQIPEIAKYPLSLKQELSYAEFLLSIAVKHQNGEDMEIQRQKIVGIYAMMDQLSPGFGFLHAYEWENRIESLFQIQEELFLRSNDTKWVQTIQHHVKTGRVPYENSLFASTQNLAFTHTYEQKRQEEELLAIQILAIGCGDIQAMRQYLQILESLVQTPEGQQFLHTFYGMYAFPTAMRSFTIYPDSEKATPTPSAFGHPLDQKEVQQDGEILNIMHSLPEASLTEYIFIHGLYISKMILGPEEQDILQSILRLLYAVGDREMIDIDGDLPEFTKIHHKIAALQAFPEALAQFPKRGQECFQILLNRLRETYGDYGLRRCAICLEFQQDIEDIFYDDICVFHAIRNLLLGNISPESLISFHFIQFEHLSREAFELLGMAVLHFKYVFAPSGDIIQPILARWYYESEGSVSAVCGILEYISELREMDDEKYGEELWKLQQLLVQDMESEQIPSAGYFSISEMIHILFEQTGTSHIPADELQSILVKAASLDKKPLSVSRETWQVNWYQEWNQFRNEACFRNACKQAVSEQRWDVFDTLIVQAHHQQSQYTIEGYVLALQILLEAPSLQKESDRIYALLERMYFFSVDRIILAPRSLRFALKEWMQHVIDGSEMNFTRTNEKILFLVSLLCKEKFPFHRPSEEIISLYWTYIESAFIARTPASLTLLLNHYGRQFEGYITVDPHNPHTYRDFFEAIEADIDVFIRIFNEEEYEFSEPFLRDWQYRIDSFLETFFMDSHGKHITPVRVKELSSRTGKKHFETKTHTLVKYWH